MKKILQYIVSFIILIFIYFLTLTLVSCIPSSIMKENVKQSAKYFLENGGEKQKINIKYKNVTLFNFTNALMINTAYSIDCENPIESFLTAKKNYIPGMTKTIYTQTPKDLMSASKYYKSGRFNGNAYQTKELYDTVYENDLDESFEYARYWHGYLLYLRPLLTFLNYEQITIMSTIIFYILLSSCAILVWKKIGKFPAIALILACITVDLFLVVKSINEILCFDLALIFSIYLLLREEKIINIGLRFFIFGSITNFLDLLTNPIVTYGIPIIIYFMIILKYEKITFKNLFFIFLNTALSWIIGYLFTWISKWVITDVLLERNIIENAIEQIGFRIKRTEMKNISLLETIKYYFCDYTAIIIYFICIFVILVNFKKLKKTINDDGKGASILTYFTCMLIPIVWYCVLSQHSLIHAFFTYRNLIVLVFALEIFVLEFVNLVYDRKKE